MRRKFNGLVEPHLGVDGAARLFEWILRLEQHASIDDYFDFAISMCLAFGAVFEVPIAILALTALGLITPQFLSKYRRHAIVVCLTAAAFITPGADPYSLFALAIPLYLLYELSVFVAMFAWRKRQKRDASREEDSREPQRLGARA